MVILLVWLWLMLLLLLENLMLMLMGIVGMGVMAMFLLKRVRGDRRERNEVWDSVVVAVMVSSRGVGAAV